VGKQMSKLEDVQAILREIKEKIADRLFELGADQEILTGIKNNFDNLYKLLGHLDSYYASLAFKDRGSYYEAKRITSDIQKFLDSVRESAVGDVNKTRRLREYIRELETILNTPTTNLPRVESGSKEGFSVELDKSCAPSTSQAVQVVSDEKLPVFREGHDSSNSSIQPDPQIHPTRQSQLSPAREGNNSDLVKINKKQDFQIRLLTSLLVLVSGLTLVYLVPRVFRWPWLDNHPDRLGLYGCATVIVLSISWAIVDKQRRVYALGTMAGGALLVLLQILGR
jgi:hypothetical protein